jgi:hypothetical protein
MKGIELSTSSLPAVFAPLTAGSETKRLGEVARKRWHQRFGDWGEWFEGGGKVRIPLNDAPKRQHILGDDVPDARFARLYEPTRIEIADGEASDTNRLIRSLTDPLQRAVEATYRWSGTVESRAAELRVHANTLRNRVALAMFECEQIWQSQRLRLVITKPN